MSENRNRVLSMLAAGTITPEQAERLLEAIGVGNGGNSGVHDAPQAGLATERVSVQIDPETEEQAGRDHDDSFTVEGTPRLIIDSFNGRVDVEGDGPANTVRVVAEIRKPGAVVYKVGQEGDTVRVEARPRGKSSFMQVFGGSRGANIKVTVPRGADVEASSKNGRVELKKVDGTFSLASSNGRIVTEDVSGTLEATTSNSRITAKRIRGSAKLRTSNGRIVVEEAHGTFEAVTSNGSIKFEGELVSGGENRLETSNGGVNVRLLGQPRVKLDASTSNGSIKCERPITTQRISGKNRLEGTIGSGDASLVVQTSNGSITVD